jgi:3-oxosteroid 1-dehydrogenase
LGTQLHLESLVFPTVDGANFRLAGPFGARLAKVPDATSLCFHVPGEGHENGDLLWRAATQVNGLPHTIVVNRMGKRFGNESHYRSLCYAVDTIDGGTQTHPNFPCWTIFDSQAREKYMFGTVMPGTDLPEGLGVNAGSLEELAGKIGIDAHGLAATIASFNRHAEKGEDPEFLRGTHPWSAWFCGDSNNKPHPNLGTLAKPPFYAVELHRMGGTGVPSTGLITDRHSRVIGWDDRAIEGLYAVGNSVARMESGALLQSGVSNARGMTHGYLAGLHAAGKPSQLLDQEIKRLSIATV